MNRAAYLALSVFLLPAVANAQTVTFGAGAKGQAAPGSAPAASATGSAGASGASGASGAPERAMLASSVPADAKTDEQKWEEREAKLDEAATLTGGVGLLHTQHAQGGAVGQFRVGFTTEYFSAGFLCTGESPCPNPRAPGASISNGTTDHIGGHLTLSMQVLKWLEPYLSTSAYANSNDANRPALLQVLGDSILGAKAHAKLGRMFHVGGAFELWLVNGTGSVGLDGAGTSAKFRALGTMDLREAKKRIPLRFSLNATYVLDNTGEVVVDTESSRGAPITRIERYGLNINRVDHFDVHVGGELFAAKDKVRPFIEYSLAAPINRQGYLCRQNNPSGDKCLANDTVVPSSLTLGGRFFPWKHGFNLLAALDIGITGVGNFIEEVRPTPPWVLYLGAGWAFDTQTRPPVVREVVVEKPVASAGRRIHGFVHEQGQTTPVAGAIVTWDNHPEETGLVTGQDGRFTTRGVSPGPYVFSIRGEGYKPGQCTVTIGGAPAAGPGAPAKPGAPATPAPAAASAGGDVQLDCPLEALPRLGAVVGRAKDGKTGAPVANAAVKIVDSAKKELTGTTDASGNFRFERLPLGKAQVTVNAEDYLAVTEEVDIKPQKESTVELALTKRPKKSLVSVGNKEIRIRQQIQFAVDSAVILPESTGLLTEIADVLLKTPRIKRVEVQGHTDNTGKPAHNQELSEQRAGAVVAWLTSHGVSPSRLEAKGYGQTKPLVPNVTAKNRAKNRRVQFIILEQDKAPKKGK